jgi:hypothetical protein
MRLAIAQQLDAALDAELARRQEARWLAADEDGRALLEGLLGCLEAELDRPVAHGQEYDSEIMAELQNLHTECAAALERLDEADQGSEHPVRGTMSQPQHKVERPPSSKPARASSRAQADVAAIPTTVEAGWR